MSDTHGHSHAPVTLPFTDSDWALFQKDDRTAGGAVVVLMTAIFTLGLVLYLGVLSFVY